MRISIAGYTLLAALLLFSAASCRKEVGIPITEKETVSIDTATHKMYDGVYVLNNGGKGSSKATLDYFDFNTGTYLRNIYAERNPSREAYMGDNATDIEYFDGHIYVVLNGSHRLVKLRSSDATFVREMHINDCGKVAFFEGKGYVTSLKKEGLRDDQLPYGEVIQFDPESMAITGRVTVGCQPAEMIFLKPASAPMLYVSNSGRYLAPSYEETISAINLETMRQEAKFKVGVNPSFMVPGLNESKEIYVALRGNYADVQPKIVHLNLLSGVVEQERHADIACISMFRTGSVVHVLKGAISKSGWTGAPVVVHLAYEDLEPENQSFDKLDEIQNGVNYLMQPDGRAYYLFDARNFTSSGVLSCYSTAGQRLWQVRTGVIPVDAAFIPKTVTP